VIGSESQWYGRVRKLPNCRRIALPTLLLGARTGRPQRSQPLGHKVGAPREPSAHLRSLLHGLAEPLPVFIILDIRKRWALLGEPSLAHQRLESPSLSVDRPRFLVSNREPAKYAAAAAARVGEPRSSGGRPIEHLDLEIVGTPGSLDINLHSDLTLPAD
jgi:hypothetical protein